MNDAHETEIPGHTVKRKTRNESEKRRRDAFNRLICELTSLVADGDRKMDKSNVLKCAINFLKQRQLRAESTTEEVPYVINAQLNRLTDCSPRELVRLYMEALNAGTFCVTCTGHIHYASNAFASFFSKTVNEIRGMNLLELLENESAKQLEQALSSEVFRAASSACTSSATSVSSSQNAPTIRLTLSASSSRKQFLMLGRLKKTSLSASTTNTEHPHHHLCESDKIPEDAIEQKHNIAGTTDDTALCFVGVARPLFLRDDSADISIETANVLQRKHTTFTIVYNTSFTCIQIDVNCALMLGYSRLEMIGTSGYEYVHVDDLNTLADSHRILMQRAVHQIEPHRLRTKAGQWLWVKCTANIQNEGPLSRVACSYSLANSPPVSSLHTSRVITQRIRSRCGGITSRTPSQPPSLSIANATPPLQHTGETLTPLMSSVQSTSSQSPMSALSISTSLPFSTFSGSSVTSSIPSLSTSSQQQHTSSSCCTTTIDYGSEQRSSTILTSPTTSSSSTSEMIATNDALKLESLTSSDNDPTNTQRLKRKHSAHSIDETATSKSLSAALSECTSPASQSSSLISPVSVTSLSPKRRLHPLVYIEHFPLPDTNVSSVSPAPVSTPVSVATPSSTPSSISTALPSSQIASTIPPVPITVTNPVVVPMTDSTAHPPVTDSPLSISPMYRHVWEELQRKSDLLRQQVLQKELELQELHLKQFLSSFRGNRST